MSTKHYWFRPKRFGWGVVPISWQGWLMTLVLLVLIFASAYANGFWSLDQSNTIQISPYIAPQNLTAWLLDVVLLVAIFALTTAPLTDGPLRWRWGQK